MLTVNPFSLVYPVLQNQTTSELQCEAATFVAQKGSTDSDCLCCMSMWVFLTTKKN